MDTRTNTIRTPTTITTTTTLTSPMRTTLPVTLMLVAAKLWWYTEASQLMPALESFWLVIHVTIACLSIALFVIGAALAAALQARSSWRVVTGWPGSRPGNSQPIGRADRHQRRSSSSRSGASIT